MSLGSSGITPLLLADCHVSPTTRRYFSDFPFDAPNVISALAAVFSS